MMKIKNAHKEVERVEVVPQDLLHLPICLPRPEGVLPATIKQADISEKIKTRFSRPLLTNRQIIKVPYWSQHPVSRDCASNGCQWSDCTFSPCCASDLADRPSLRSHRRTVWSTLPLAKMCLRNG